MKKKLKRFYLIWQLLIFLPVVQLIAQDRTLTGVVTSQIDGTTLPGVSILVDQTTIGTSTNAEGFFTIDVPADSEVLVFRMVGMVTKEVPITAVSHYEVELEQELYALDEVVAVGYGTMMRSDLTGSVSSVRSEEISAIPSTTLSQALQGRSAGVHVVRQSGEPGSYTQIRIRGTGSIQGGNDPLWVIDGTPGDPNMLNTNDIERIEVLKDASSTAIFGSRGANGVILVTTKRGAPEERTRVDYEQSYSVQTLRKKLDLMNAQEYAQFYNIQQINDMGVEYFSQSEINAFGEGYDYQDMLFEAAPLLNHSLNIRGGSERTQYLVGGTYYDEQGIMLNNHYRRISLRSTLDHEISKMFSVRANIALAKADRQSQSWAGGNRGGSLIGSIVSAPPTVDAYDEDGNYRLLTTTYPFSSNAIVNPMAIVNEIENLWHSNRVNTTLGFTFAPISGLSFNVSGNIYNHETLSDNYTATRYPGSSGSASKSTGNTTRINLDNIVNYTKTFNDLHRLNVTGGYTYEHSESKSHGASVSGFLVDNYRTHNFGAASTAGRPGSSHSDWTLVSYLGRINYVYDNKYLATVTFRTDGSSRYSEGNKWSSFPSGAIGYRISEENFMEDFDFISNLMLRISHGASGSTAISPYQTLDNLGVGTTTMGRTAYPFFAPGARFPGHLTWETSVQTDIGIDLSLFNHRIGVTADYYIRNTYDLLNPVQLPHSTGYTNTLMNVGEMENKGFELDIRSRVLQGRFTWDLSTNVSFNRNKILKLYDGQDIFGSTYHLGGVADFINLLREAEPFGVFYGFVEDGYTEDGFIKSKEDRTIIGDPNPDFTFGVNSRMSFQNFHLGFFINGTYGNDIYSFALLNQTVDYGFGLNTLREVLYDHWTPETPNAKYPKISRATQTEFSDRYVHDGSFLRLRNIELGYDIPINQLGINWLRQGQVYVSGQNLLTLTSYPWWDPEVNSLAGSTSRNQGIDYYTYPTSKSITFGIRLGF